MLNLKTILKTKAAKEGIQSDLCSLINLDLNAFLKDTLPDNKNSITKVINHGNMKYQLSCTLYYDFKKNIYLLECWLSNFFTNEDINTFLAIFNSECERIMADIEECVWSVGDWQNF